MSRRGENIRKRKDGRWEGRYSIFEPRLGRNVVRSVYARSYSEVKEKLLSAKLSAQAADSCSKCVSEIRFCLVAEEWLASMENSKKYATFIKYPCELKVCSTKKPWNPAVSLALPAILELFALCVIRAFALKGEKNVPGNNA